MAESAKRLDELGEISAEDADIAAEQFRSDARGPWKPLLDARAVRASRQPAETPEEEGGNVGGTEGGAAGG